MLTSLQLKLVAALAIVLMLGGAYAWGRHDGRSIEASAWNKRELAITAESNARLQAAQNALIAKERDQAAQLAMVSGHYQTELKRTNDEKERVVAAVRAGDRRLYVNAACPPGRDAVPGAQPAAGGRDGEARAELSREAAEFLVSLAGEADAVVQQLVACQAVIAAERKPQPPK